MPLALVSRQERKMRLLVIRFSALGDIAMTVPVVESLRRAHPEVEVTVLTSGAGAAVYGAVSDVRVRAVHFRQDAYRGVEGLQRLYRELRDEGYDAVADLHNVLRTRFLRMRFHLSGTRVEKVRKGRAEKYALTHHTRPSRPLQPMTERYRDVFRRLGLDFEVAWQSPLRLTLPALGTVLPGGGGMAATGTQSCEAVWSVGIAPFAQHRGKIYPIERMERVVHGLLEADPRVRIYLLGSADERVRMAAWEQDAAAAGGRVTNLAGRGTLQDDIRLMARLGCVVSMDSANMHLASLAGTPVVSVWGATHPYAGFLGYGQSDAGIVQLPLACRPCSIYGKKACRYGDYRCLTGIEPDIIVKRVLQTLRQSHGIALADRGPGPDRAADRETRSSSLTWE